MSQEHGTLPLMGAGPFRDNFWVADDSGVNEYNGLSRP
jgi:hypothetical protein